MRGAGRVKHAIGRRALRLAERASGVTYHRDEPGIVRFGVYRRPEGPRWGWGSPPHPGFARQLASRHDDFLEQLELIRRYGDELGAIDRDHRDDFEPCWTNPLFIGIDGASLYGFLRDRRPAAYLEVGSGYSTRFAARAKRDGALATAITSIDPEPRVGIDTICDRIVREPLETVDQDIFRTLRTGDIVLFDGSHRILAGNDVAVFFLEILPELPSGVLVGVHDIFIPDDYASGRVEDCWTEQYMLMATLLGDTSWRTVLPCHYVATVSPMTERLDERWEAIGLAGTNAWGSLYWFERA